MNDQPKEPFAFTVTVDENLLDTASIALLEEKLPGLVLAELAQVDLARTLVTLPLPTARSFGDGGGFGGGIAGRHVSKE